MDNPVVIHGRLTKWDFFSNSFYYWRRQALSWLIYSLILATAIVIFPAYSSNHEIVLHDLFVALGTMAWLFFAFFAVMLVCTLGIFLRTKAKVLNRMITTSFMTDGIKVDCDGSYAFTKYGELKGVFLYKKHIIVQYMHNACSIIPWRDVPVDKHEELKLFLKDVKKKVKI